MEEKLTDIRIIDRYRGVGIHDGQSAHRVDSVVKPEIDKVFALADAGRLAAIAADVQWAPEARLLAAAMVIAIYQEAAEERRERPKLDPDAVRASVTGLDKAEWRDPDRYCSLLDAPPLGTKAPLREVPLTEEE